MSTDISQEDHDLAIQELTKKYAAERARFEHMQEAEITKRVAAALAAPSAPASSPLTITFSANIHFPDQESAAETLVSTDPFVGSEYFRGSFSSNRPGRGTEGAGHSAATTGSRLEQTIAHKSNIGVGHAITQGFRHLQKKAGC